MRPLQFAVYMREMCFSYKKWSDMIIKLNVSQKIEGKKALHFHGFLSNFWEAKENGEKDVIIEKVEKTVQNSNVNYLLWSASFCPSFAQQIKANKLFHIKKTKNWDNTKKKVQKKLGKSAKN